MSYKIESPLPVIEGGTGKQNFVPYSVICGGTGGGPTTDDDLQSVVSVGSLGYVLTSNGPGALPTFQNVSAPGAISTIDADIGTVTPVSGVINVLAGISTQHCGSTVLFDGLADTLELNVSDILNNTIIGLSSGNATLTGTENTVLGIGSGIGLTSGNNNTFIGNDVGRLVTDGINTVAIGNLAGAKLTTGGANTLIGVLAGFDYAGNENSNICIGYSVEGNVGETNTLRIGNGTGSSPGEIAQTFISGIDGVDVGSTAVVVTEFANQLGTAVITAGTGITITPGPNTITISADAAGVVETLTGDVGGGISPSAGNINIFADGGTNNSGCSVEFDGSGDTLTLNVTDGNSNTIIGQGAGNGTVAGDNNTVLGKTAAQDLTSGTDNSFLGFDAGASITSGSFNVLLGSEAGSSYTSSESSNILINASGTIADSNTLRIGSATGSGNGELNKAFICGIDGVNVGSTATVVTEAGNQLGTAVITAGTGISVGTSANAITINTSGSVSQGFDTDSGTAIPSANTIHINAGNASNICGSSVEFIGSGSTVQLNVTDINDNTIIGLASGNLTLTGTGNTVLGENSLTALTTGFNNTAIGGGCLNAITAGISNTVIGQACAPILDGSGNTMIGQSCATLLLSGDNNVFLGDNTADNYTSNESNNILIGHVNSGVVGDQNTLRIGLSTGSGAGQLNKAFISGINGVNVGSVATVVTEASDQLGTAVITAGSGITVTPSANAITLASTGGFSAYTAVNTSPYVAISTDVYISVDSSGGAITVQLPNAATLGRIFEIKDRTGSAAINNITVTTVGGAVNIDGATTYVLNLAYQSVTVIGNGSTYEVY